MERRRQVGRPLGGIVAWTFALAVFAALLLLLTTVRQSAAAPAKVSLGAGDERVVYCDGKQLTTTPAGTLKSDASCTGKSKGLPVPPGSTVLRRGETVRVRCSADELTVSRNNKRTATFRCSEGAPPPGSVTMLGGCQVFPADNPWNQEVSALPRHTNSAGIIAQIQADAPIDVNGPGGQPARRFLHADFGSNPDYGIPFVIVPQNEPLVPIHFTAYGDESDPGPYPIPLDAPVEAGSDRHVLALQQGACKLYELYGAVARAARWDAASGAVFDLSSNALRPDYWTSADAAGLPILPGLVRWEEVQSGVITHALRVTFGQTQRAFLHPATHYASCSLDPDRPAMGLRLRVRADYDISGFSGDARVILEAAKKYGLIVADNGSNWFISGATDSRWDDEDLNQLKTVPGTAFEVVDTGDAVVGGAC